MHHQKLIVAIVICLLAGAIGSVFTASEITTWYSSLNKPFFTPPNWVFAPAWTVLYILMGLSLYLVWISNSKEKHDAMRMFELQLLLNVAWSFLFFGLHSPLLGLAGIIVLWLAIFQTMEWFHKISKKATYLLVPYILWTSFALVLNLAVFAMN